MHRHRIPGSMTSAALAAAAIVLAITVSLASCSSDSETNPPTTASSVDSTAPNLAPVDLDGTTTTTIGPTKVALRTTPLGDIVVDADGMTLYAKVTVPTDGCTGTCLDAWPTVRATSVAAGAGIDPTTVTIVDPNSTSTTQTTTSDTSSPDSTSTTTATPVADGVVAISGRVLYRFVGDVVPGDTTGQGFNSTFFVVLADGTLVQPPPSTTTTSTP